MYSKDDAKTIADLIAHTDTEDRGFLLLAVASELEKYMQYYTSAVIYKAGELYNQE